MIGITMPLLALLGNFEMNLFGDWILNRNIIFIHCNNLGYTPLNIPYKEYVIRQKIFEVLNY